MSGTQLMIFWKFESARLRMRERQPISAKSRPAHVVNAPNWFEYATSRHFCTSAQPKPCSSASAQSNDDHHVLCCSHASAFQLCHSPSASSGVSRHVRVT